MDSQTLPRFRPDSPRFLGALEMAATLHAGQTRKSTDIPYVGHLLSVAGIVIEYGANEDEAVAALLHDAPEDCGGLPVLEEIRRRFGESVAEIVSGCTDTFEAPKPEWKRRKAHYIARLPRESASVRLVSAADKLHNARSILMDYRREGDKVFDRFRADSKHHTVWYYRKLADTYLSSDPGSALFEEVDRVVSEIERLAGGGVERERVFRELDEVLAARAAEAKE